MIEKIIDKVIVVNPNWPDKNHLKEMLGKQEAFGEYLRGNIDEKELINVLGKGYNYSHVVQKQIKDFTSDINKEYEKESTKMTLKFLLENIEPKYKGDVYKELRLTNILEVYPEFFDELLDKDEYLKECREACKDSLSFINFVKKRDYFRPQIDELLESDLVKVNGFYNDQRNLWTVFNQIKLKEMKEANEKEANEFLVEYVLKLADDHYTTYNSNEPWKGRARLSDKGKDALKNLLLNSGNYEEDIKILKEELPLGDGHKNRPVPALFTKDDDLKKLAKTLEEWKEDGVNFKVIDRFFNIKNEVFPYNYISKKYFNDFTGSCAFSDPKGVIKELKRLEEELDEKEADWAKSYVVEYNIQHNCCEIKKHEEMAKEIIESLGPEFVKKYFTTTGRYLRPAGLEVYSRFSSREFFAEELDQIEKERIEKLLGLVAVEGKEDELRDYFLGKIDKINVKKVIKKDIDQDESYSIRFFFSLRDEVKDRILKVALESKNKVFIRWYIYEMEKKHMLMPHKDVMESLKRVNINVDLFLREMLDHSHNWKDSVNYDDSFRYVGVNYKDNILRQSIAYLDDLGIDILEEGKKLAAKLKAEMLASLLYKKQIDKSIELLIDMAGASQKNIYEPASILLGRITKEKISEFEDLVTKKIGEFSIEQEERVITALSKLSLNFEVLGNLHSKVKNPNSRDLLEEFVLDAPVTEFDLDRFLDNNYVEPKKMPIELDKLQLPVRKDGKDATRAIKHLILAHKVSNEIKINKEAIQIANEFTKESMEAFAGSVFDYWSEVRDIKDSWQLLIACIHASPELIRLIEKEADDYAYAGRQKVGAFMTKALGLSGKKAAFMSIERLKRKSKFNSIKKAADEALDIAASELGIDQNELGDMLVSDFGLENGYIEVDYGSSKLKLHLTEEFKFEIEKEDGKKVKSMPKGKAEDAERVKEAKKEFTALKKDLKEVVSLQQIRLREAFVIFRKWDSNKWSELFLENPIMNILGKKLLWGRYKGDSLVEAFALDTDLININYQDIKLEKNDKIALVHPSELEDVEDWKEYFEDNEVELLFNQLHNEEIDIDSEKVSYDFGRSSSTIQNHLKKANWKIAFIGDGGSFNSFDKELKDYSGTITLTFDDYMDFYDGYASKVEEIAFTGNIPNRVKVEVHREVKEIVG